MLGFLTEPSFLILLFRVRHSSRTASPKVAEAPLIHQRAPQPTPTEVRGLPVTLGVRYARVLACNQPTSSPQIAQGYAPPKARFPSRVLAHASGALETVAPPERNITPGRHVQPPPQGTANKGYGPFSILLCWCRNSLTTPVYRHFATSALLRAAHATTPNLFL